MKNFEMEFLHEVEQLRGKEAADEFLKGLIGSSVLEGLGLKSNPTINVDILAKLQVDVLAAHLNGADTTEFKIDMVRKVIELEKDAEDYDEVVINYAKMGVDYKNFTETLSEILVELLNKIAE